MTDQNCDDIDILMPGVEFGDWDLYAAIRGEPSKENHGWGLSASVHRTKPRSARRVSTANGKGYKQAWRLDADGTLVLVSFTYGDTRQTELVNEAITGDFYLVLKSVFRGPRLYVPFRDGKIVLDRARWLHEAFVGANREVLAGCHPDFPETARRPYG
jgi:hypothetical protein